MSNTLIVFGRTHNPFNGDPEIWVHPDGNAIADRVREELLKQQAANKVVEIESDGKELNVRPLRRTINAAVNIAIREIDAGSTTPEQVLASIPQDYLLKLLNTRVADVSGLTELGNGLAASPGAVTGVVASSAKAAVEEALKGARVILVVAQTTPEDMNALEKVIGIVNTSGGYTSHSAVVARQLGKPCIVSYKGPLPTGTITIDGASGKVFSGEAKYKDTNIDENTNKILSLIDKVAKLKVFANADTSDHVRVALQNGAAGIGLCRTEHTFFTESGLRVIRRLILAKTPAEKESALQELYTVQKTHFVNVFKTLGDNPATIRLLDPPFHEFLPSEHDSAACKDLAHTLKRKLFDVKNRVKELHELNPMLGHRGVRLSVTFPTLAQLQTKAIVEAARIARKSGSGPSEVGIMVPLVVSVKEMQKITQELREGIDMGVNAVDMTEKQTYLIGAMLETPRACLITHELAELCDFFSFGTNDLTQTVWALSRDDGSKFMSEYATQGLVDKDPFEVLDVSGVGQLMAHAVESLGDRRSKVKIGICGEHGGDRISIDFCHKLGIDYISCAPPRVQSARIAAAYAAASVKNATAPEKIILDQPIVLASEKVVDTDVVGSKPVPPSEDAPAGFTGLTVMNAQELLDTHGSVVVAVDKLVSPDPDSCVQLSDKLIEATVVGIMKDSKTVVLSMPTGNPGHQVLALTGEGIIYAKGHSEKTLSTMNLWLTTINLIKFVKAPKKGVTMTSDKFTVPTVEAVTFGKYAVHKKEWTEFDPTGVQPTTMVGWQITTDGIKSGTVLGASKTADADMPTVIANFSGTDAAINIEKIALSAIKKIAPPGTAAIAKPAMNVVKPTNLQDLKSLKVLPYKELSAELLGKFVQIQAPAGITDAAKPIWCQIVGNYPSQNDVKVFVCHLPSGLEIKDKPHYLNPLIKFIDSNPYNPKEIVNVMVDAILDVKSGTALSE